MFVIYIEPHTTGSCPKCTDLLPTVIALSAVLFAVVLLLAVAILTIVLLYTSESDVIIFMQVCMSVLMHALKGNATV